jgi:hypothetical protein
MISDEDMYRFAEALVRWAERSELSAGKPLAHREGDHVTPSTRDPTTASCQEHRNQDDRKDQTKR